MSDKDNGVVGSIDQYGFVFIGSQKFVPVIELEQTKSRISDLEAKLQAANRKVDELTEMLADNVCGYCTRKMEEDPTGTLSEENTKLKALLGEAMRILEMVDLTDYELGLLRELEVKLQEASK